MRIYNKKAFSLVELITIIIILIILWTIAFISFQWYSKYVRDSKRLSDISNIRKSLELFQLNTWQYPLPNQFRDITYSWAKLRYQWVFWEDNLINVKKINKLPVDPLFDIEYTYSVTNKKNEYELWSILESTDLWINTYFENWATQQTIAYITWNYNWKIIKTSQWNTTYILAVPSIINWSLNLENIFDLIDENKLVYNWFTNIPSSYSWTFIDIEEETNLNIVNKNNILLFEWNIDDLINDNSNTRITLLQNLQNAYTWTLISDLSWINEIFALWIVDIDNPKIKETELICWILWFNDCYSTSTSEWSQTISYSCAEHPTIENANFLEWTPSQENQNWEYDYSQSKACSWKCNDWYNKWFWDTCILTENIIWNWTINTDWNEPWNWTPNIVPSISNDVIIDSCSNWNITLDLNWWVTVWEIKLWENCLSTLNLKNWNEITNKLVLTKSLIIWQKGNLTHSNNTTTKNHIINIEAWNLIIDSWWTINVSGKWYSPNNWPWWWTSNTSQYWWWWWHWWYWWNWKNWVIWWVSNDNYINPIDLWSWWWYSWAWWWVIKLILNWNLVNNGSIQANWNNYSSRWWWWAWWSIWLDVNEISWNWTITWNWWNWNLTTWWWWAWGRLALYYNQSVFDIDNISLLWGSWYRKWWIWTKYIEKKSTWVKSLYVVWNTTTLTNWKTVLDWTISELTNLYIWSWAYVEYIADSFSDISWVLEIENATLTSISSWILNMPEWSINIKEGWILNHKNNTNTKLYTLNIIANNTTINNWWTINVSGKWYSPNNWPWWWTSNTSQYWWWWWHWWYWWNWKNWVIWWVSNDNYINPIDLWSWWWYSWAWWWVIKLILNWNLVNNGSIQANWNNYSSRWWWWAWWSIWLDVNEISWNWTITWNWWNWNNPYSWWWSWWRIAIYYNTSTYNIDWIKVNWWIWLVYWWIWTKYIENKLLNTKDLYIVWSSKSILNGKNKLSWEYSNLTNMYVGSWANIDLLSGVSFNISNNFEIKTSKIFSTHNLNIDMWTANLIIGSWSILSHYKNSNTRAYNLDISAWNMVIEAWWLIDLYWRWYTFGNWPWAWSKNTSTYWWWWWHWWYWWDWKWSVSWWIINDSISAPIDLWSWWWSSWNWWWAFKLQLTWNLIHNWTINANWTNHISRWGGWAWWSVWLNVNGMSWNWTILLNWWTWNPITWWWWWWWIFKINYNNASYNFSNISVYWWTGLNNWWNWSINY